MIYVVILALLLIPSVAFAQYAPMPPAPSTQYGTPSIQAVPVPSVPAPQPVYTPPPSPPPSTFYPQPVPGSGATYAPFGQPSQPQR